MNFKSILVVGLGVATLGLSLPAHADTATVISNNQQAVVSGSGNFTSQSNNTSVRNSQIGRTSGNTGTSVSNSQFADVLGRNNFTSQTNSTSVNNYQRRPR
jgi:hypothetical protein